MSIKIENASYVYNKGMSIETLALDNINLKIGNQKFIAITGYMKYNTFVYKNLINYLSFGRGALVGK